MWQSPITTLNAGMSERGTELKPIRKHVASLRPHSHSPSIGFELRLDFAHAALDQSQQSELNHFNASVQLNPRAEVQVRSIYIHLIQLIHAFQKSPYSAAVRHACAQLTARRRHKRDSKLVEVSVGFHQEWGPPLSVASVSVSSRFVKRFSNTSFRSFCFWRESERTKETSSIFPVPFPFPA